MHAQLRLCTTCQQTVAANPCFSWSIEVDMLIKDVFSCSCNSLRTSTWWFAQLPWWNLCEREHHVFRSSVIVLAATKLFADIGLNHITHYSHNAIHTVWRRNYIEKCSCPHRLWFGILCNPHRAIKHSDFTSTNKKGPQLNVVSHIHDSTGNHNCTNISTSNQDFHCFTKHISQYFKLYLWILQEYSCCSTFLAHAAHHQLTLNSCHHQISCQT
jgi:hypothetical protein